MNLGTKVNIGGENFFFSIDRPVVTRVTVRDESGQIVTQGRSTLNPNDQDNVILGGKIALNRASTYLYNLLGLDDSGVSRKEFQAMVNHDLDQTAREEAEEAEEERVANEVLDIIGKLFGGEVEPQEVAPIEAPEPVVQSSGCRGGKATTQPWEPAVGDKVIYVGSEYHFNGEAGVISDTIKNPSSPYPYLLYIEGRPTPIGKGWPVSKDELIPA